ncbi:MAG: TonB-dependent receptor plug domain-containing protein [Gemmobacter sp.]|uniref:TonB-dependent receptor plug domain-containing protein n=1 Tax=Gemmobacter sp. TaxID=1898957 RepID=UPI00391AED5D
MRLSGISLLALALAALPARAEVIDLEDIVVSANRLETEARRTGASVSVVTAEDLAATGATTLVEALDRLPGVSFSQQGPVGNGANLRIRGADRRYIAVFVDGIRVTDPTQTETAFDFGALLTADIGRVEILRGSQSALWGGSAVGGVVNITTRAAMRDGFAQEVELEAGTWGTVKGRYTLTHRTARSETALSFAHLKTDGFSAAAAGTERDGAEISRLSFSTRHQVTDTLAIGASAFHQKTRQDYDGFVGWAVGDAANTQRRTETGARLFAEWQAGRTTHVFDATRYRVNRLMDEAGTLSRFTGLRSTFGWQATTEVSERFTLVYGADTMLETARYTALPTGQEKTRISGVFAQGLWRPSDRLDVSGTLRRDRNSQFGGFTTGRLAVAFQLDGSTTLRAAAATGFRAPSIDERFGNYPGSFFVGNPALTPEKSRSLELGLERRFDGGAMVGVTLFALDIDNLITYLPCPGWPCPAGTVNTMTNLPGASKRRGVELEAQVPLSDRLTLAAAYTYTEARRPNGARLGLVPRHDLGLTLDARLGEATRLSVGLKHAAGRLNDFAFAAMPDYTVVNAGLTQDLGSGTEAWVKVNNIFDRRYQLSDGYAAPGRSVMVGLRKSF